MNAEDAYATWDDAIAKGNTSDAHDGLPDNRIIPLVEHLRAKGLVTLQSCTGHTPTGPGMFDGTDGHLWVLDEPPFQPVLGDIDETLFQQISWTVWPVPRLELLWLPAVFDAAAEHLMRLEPSPIHSPWACRPETCGGTHYDPCERANEEVTP